MIICNGVVGLCILVGGLVHHEQSFRVEGSSAGLAALIALSAFSLVLPAFTTTTSGGTYSDVQLAFAALMFGGHLGGLRLHSDRAASRLLPPAGGRIESRRARRPADGPRVVGQLRPAYRIARVGRRAGQASVALDRASGRASGRAEGGDRDRNRDAGSAPRDVGRGARRARQPSSDQHEPGARVGAGEPSA